MKLLSLRLEFWFSCAILIVRKEVEEVHRKKARTMTKLLKVPEKKPEDMKSKFIHQHRSVHEEMHDLYLDDDNDNMMKTQGLDQIAKMLDAIGHFERKS
jgi:hypothetical protein